MFNLGFRNRDFNGAFDIWGEWLCEENCLLAIFSEETSFAEWCHGLEEKSHIRSLLHMSYHHIAKGNRIYKMNKADLFLYVKWPHRQSPVLGLFFACLLYRLSFVKLLESFECNRSVVLISNGATLRRCGRCSRRDRNLPALTRLQTFTSWERLQDHVCSSNFLKDFNRFTRSLTPIINSLVNFTFFVIQPLNGQTLADYPAMPFIFLYKSVELGDQLGKHLRLDWSQKHIYTRRRGQLKTNMVPGQCHEMKYFVIFNQN